MSLPALEKAILNVVKGIHSIEEFGERLVRGAVYETIHVLSERYGLDEQRLKETIADALIKSHSKILPTEETCSATTCRGKRCLRPVIADGLCDFHHKKNILPKKRARVEHKDETVEKMMRIFTSARQSQRADRSP